MKTANEGSRTERLPQDTSERILASAEAILAERGYEGLSMRAVGARAGISQAAIYRHYSDKSALVGTIVARGYARIVGRLEGILASGGNEAELLASSMKGYVELSLERPELFKAVLLRGLGPAQEGANVLARGVSEGRRSMALLVGALERGMASGAFVPADPELTAQAVWAAMYGLTARIVLEGLEPCEHRAALVDREVELVVRGLVAR
jgi:AcrR family transcriptional regulator